MHNRLVAHSLPARWKDLVVLFRKDRKNGRVRDGPLVCSFVGEPIVGVEGRAIVVPVNVIEILSPALVLVVLLVSVFWYSRGN